MGSYIGKVQIGSNPLDQVALGDTLFGTCTTTDSTALKEITIPDLDRVINGIQIRVRFANGNTVDSNVQLKINTGSTVNTYTVDGDCTCSANDVIAFTWESDGTTSRWRVVGNSLTKTIKDYVSSVASGAISGIDSMVFKGTIGTSGATVSSLPTSGYTSGWTYKAITTDATNNFGLSTTPGDGQGPVEPGDLIIAISNAGQNQSTFQASHWTVVQTNIDGAVTGPSSATSGHIAVFDGTTGKLISDSGHTIATDVPANAVFTDTNTSYQYSLTNTQTTDAFTGIASSYNDQDQSTNSKLLASISNGVLILEKGITFSTTPAMTSTALSESAVQGPAVSSGT